MASDIDFEVQQRRARRLVRGVVGVGLGAGTLMLAAFAFSILRAHANQTAMNAVAASADRFFFNTAELLAHYQREMSTQLAGQRPQQDAANSSSPLPALDELAGETLRSAGGHEEFAQYYAALKEVQNCEDQARQWADRKSAVETAAGQADARDDAALVRLQETLERAAGRARLERAVQLRQYRALGRSADPALLAKLAAASLENDSLPLAQKELNTLAMLIERIQNAGSLDDLLDIKDNQFRPALARLQRQLPRLDKSPAAPANSTLQRLNELLSTLFGDGAWNDDEHQTIRPGTNGFFGLCQQRLELARQLRQLQGLISAALATADFAKLKLAQNIQATTTALAAASTASFEHAWWSTLAVASIGGFSFCLLSFKTAGVLRRQFLEVVAATKTAQAGEQRVRRLIDASLDAVITMNQQGIVIGWNTRAEQILGWQAADAAGLLLVDTILAEKYRRDFGRWIREYLDTGRDTRLNQRLEVRALHRDGHEIPVDLTVVPVPLGSQSEFNVFLQDITRRKQNEFAITRILADATSLAQATPRILAEICALHHWDFAALWLIDSATNQLACLDIWRNAALASEEFATTTRRARFARGDGLPGRAWQEGRPICVSDLNEEAVLCELREGVRGYLCEVIEFPIVVGSNVLGVLEALSCTVRGANDEMLLTLSTVGSRVGHFIQRERAEQALRVAEAKSRSILAAIPDTLFQLNSRGLIVDLQAPAAASEVYSAERMLGKRLGEAFPEGIAHKISAGVEAAIRTARVQAIEYYLFDSGNKTRHYEAQIAPMGESGCLVIARDVSDRQQMQTQLAQAQKLESIGQLAAGVAHEINTPIQYVGDNTRFLQDSFASVSRLLGEYGELLGAAQSDSLSPERLAAAAARFQQAEVPFLIDEIPAAIGQSLEGIDRVATIVRALKGFSHPDGDQKELTDLNQCIENTVLVAKNEWKYVAEVVTDLDPQLPLVSCLAGAFNQVVLNLTVNAAHAIADVRARDPNHRGTIRIGTRLLDDWVEVRVGDNGSGIPEAIRGRVFDPFFTTKAVGRGTGQGLAIAHAVVVKKHGGTISLETEPGRGTTFIIRLPIGNPLAEQPLPEMEASLS